MQTTIKCFDQYHYLQYTKYYPVWKNKKNGKNISCSLTPYPNIRWIKVFIFCVNTKIFFFDIGQFSFFKNQKYI